MNDLEAAKLVLISSAAADGGCVPCVQGCIDEALNLAPDLPWDEALSTLSGSRAHHLKKAIESSREWLAAGNAPRNSEDDDDLPEIVIA